MVTMFSTPKPFVGHIDVIQRNAIESWQRLHPDIEILLIGDDKGAAEVCQEFGIRHVKDVRRNRNGTKYLASIYDRAQEIAGHDLLCHVNCDILLMSDFRLAVESMRQGAQSFLALRDAAGMWTFANRGTSSNPIGKTGFASSRGKPTGKDPHSGSITLFSQKGCITMRFQTL